MIYSSNKVRLDIGAKNIMSVNVPVLKFDDVSNYSDRIQYGFLIPIPNLIVQL